MGPDEIDTGVALDVGIGKEIALFSDHHPAGVGNGKQGVVDLVVQPHKIGFEPHRILDAETEFILILSRHEGRAGEGRFRRHRKNAVQWFGTDEAEPFLHGAKTQEAQDQQKDSSFYPIHENEGNNRQK